MSKLALSLAGLMVMLCFLGKAQADPARGSTLVTVTIDGKVVKQVQLNEGDNVIPLCDEYRLVIKVANGKAVDVRALDRANRCPASRVSHPPGAVRPAGEVCLDLTIHDWKVIGLCFTLKP